LPMQFRTDAENLKKMDSIVVPKDLRRSWVLFAFSWKYGFERRGKVILFSYPSQTFAAYENGQLVRTGPTIWVEKRSNSNWFVFLQIGKQRKPPVRLMTSGLKWNFNIANKLGVGFHQYSLRVIPLRILVCDYKSEMLATYMIGRSMGLLMLKR
jgi:hypothetical protein